MESVESRVAKGAEWLDENKPGWEKLINFETLEMSNTCRCVLGQVFKNDALDAKVYEYDEVEEGEEFDFKEDGQGWKLVPVGFDYVMRVIIEEANWAEDMGFDMPSDVLQFYGGETKIWVELRDAWESLVKTRFSTGALSDSNL